MLNPELSKYTLDHSSPEQDLLAELGRETFLKAMHPRMISGHLQGMFLKYISLMVRPANILEIGTYTGYSAICLAQGLGDNGLLYTIDNNPEIKYISEKFIKKANLADKIVQFDGAALDIIPQLDKSFDLVFIDADKENYLNYYNVVLPKVKKGGWILADNVLWDGKVTKPGAKSDKETAGIIEFNDFVQKDNRVENFILPLRDGIMLIRKLEQ